MDYPIKYPVEVVVGFQKAYVSIDLTKLRGVFRKNERSYSVLSCVCNYFLNIAWLTSIPPGQTLYNLPRLPNAVTTHEVGGFVYDDALIKAIFNGVVYGIIVWLIFSITTHLTKKHY